MHAQPFEARRLSGHADAEATHGLVLREHSLDVEHRRGSLAKIEGDDLPFLGDVEERKAAFAETARQRVDDAEGEGGSDGSVERISSAVEQLERSRGGVCVIGRDRDVRSLGARRKCRLGRKGHGRRNHRSEERGANAGRPERC